VGIIIVGIIGILLMYIGGLVWHFLMIYIGMIIVGAAIGILLVYIVMIMAYIGMAFAIYKKSKIKSCGDFDNKTSLGVYICYDCIKEEKTRKNFLSQYDKLTEARTD
jgi:hypothetical protein